MIIRRLICGLLVFLLAQSSIRAESYWQLALEDHDKDSSQAKTNPRFISMSKEYEQDMFWGYFMAIGPGFFVHGAGNMYAGNWGKGLILFGLEILSLTGLLFVAGDRWEADERGEEVGTETDILEIASWGLFIGTWVWDIVTVGGEIKEKNQNKLQIGVGALPTANENKSKPQFGIRLRVSFL